MEYSHFMELQKTSDQADIIECEALTTLTPSITENGQLGQRIRTRYAQNAADGQNCSVEAQEAQ